MIESQVAQVREDRLALVVLEGLTKLSRQLKTIKLPDGITQERVSTLGTIDSNAPISVTALADIENVRAPTMSRMIASLEEGGLVRRREHKTDGRGVLLSLTAKGRRTYKRATQQSLSQLGEALGRLSEDQLTALSLLVGALDSLPNKNGSGSS